VLIGLAAGGLFWYVHGWATSQSEDNVRFHTSYVADTIVSDHLRPSDFTAPVTGARLLQLDDFFRREVLVGDVVRVKVYSPAGKVVYSTDHPLIGTTPDEPDAREVFADNVPLVDVTDLNHEGGNGNNFKVIESYARVVIHGRPVGVFEIYQDYQPIAAAVRQTFLPIAGALGLVLILLYATLVPILRRVTQRLRKQMAHIEH
jgi:hypothetical protein